LPDATPTSIAPPSPSPRNRRWLAVQIILTAIILWFVAGRLIGQWRTFRGTPTEALHPRWALIGLSCLVVFAAYAVLIETMRRLIVAWGEQLTFGDAARIWSLSGLVRYLPYNQLFQIGAIAELARRRQIRPAPAAGAALINTVVNLAVGFVIALAAGWDALNALSNGHAALGVAVVGLLLVGLLMLPIVLPRLLGLVRRVTNRPLVLAALPRRALYEAMLGNVVSWLLYGVAYQLFVTGLLGHAGGSTLSYIAVWAVSYVVGYLAILMPAGAVVRELTQTNGLTLLGLATLGQAFVIPIYARVWLTVLEILPALVFLAHAARTRSQEAKHHDGSTS